MNNDFCRNAGLHAPPQHLDAPSSSSLTMTNWNFVPSAMEVDGQDHQCSFFRQNWREPSTAPEQSIFESALSSLVSSPATATNSGDSFMIGELIGKLGNIGNSCSGEFLPSCSSSCYSTPLNSPPPKLTFPPAIEQTIPSLSQTTPLGPTMAAPELAADPGFAERAARFSRLGGGSFNGRTTPFSSSNTSDAGAVLPNGKMPRVGSTAVGSQDESTVSQQIPSGAKFSGAVPRKRKSFPGGKVKESSVGASPSNNAGKEGEFNTDDAKTKRSKSKEKETEKAEEEEKQSKSNEEKPPAEPPKDYIHVRARRGQATDSHSLAERVRREKISERMKLLQNLVPGCNKVTGKALMLDEIINYVQSLQRQVEFLSMKLASVDTRLDINVDSLRSKNIIQANNYSENGIFQYDASAAMVKQPTSNPLIPMHQFDHSALRPMPLPPHQNLPQSFYEDDLQTIVYMGLRQKQDFYDSNQMPITDTNP